MNTETITIDGSIGEGGGQILRSSLTLAAITGKKLVIDNIRANRKKPGLLRQHRTCVLAAAQACHAKVEGSELGSTRLSFTPADIQSGDFEFTIGTAGSTVLVAQTLMPILLFANAQSTVNFTGGTHNDMAPSLCFYQKSFLPVLQQMGVRCEITQTSYGFNPVGGGNWQLTVNPVDKLKPVKLDAVATSVDDYQIIILSSQLPKNICTREIDTACKYLGWPLDCATIKQVESPGSGNSVQLVINAQHHQQMVENYGRHGVSAERIAKQAATKASQILRSKVAVETHLADQLLLPMALAGSGSFTTLRPSEHLLTNIGIIEQFLAVKISVEQITDQAWHVEVI